MAHQNRERMGPWEMVKGQIERNFTDESKQKEPRKICPFVGGVEVTLHEKKAVERKGETSNAAENLVERRNPGEKDSADMVNGHGKQCNIF